MLLLRVYPSTGDRFQLVSLGPIYLLPHLDLGPSHPVSVEVLGPEPLRPKDSPNSHPSGEPLRSTAWRDVAWKSGGWGVALPMATGDLAPGLFLS